MVLFHFFSFSPIVIKQETFSQLKKKSEIGSENSIAVNITFDICLVSVVQPLLIVSTVLSAIYLGFSILLLKGIKQVSHVQSVLKVSDQHIFFQKDKKKVLPWLVWSILYIIILLPCAIYELTLGGKILEVTIVPIFYLIIFGCWVYCILCIWAYFKTLPKRPPVRRQSQFFMDLSGTLPRIFPHNKWEDSSASGIGLTNRPHYSDEAAAEVVYDYLIGTRV